MHANQQSEPSPGIPEESWVDYKMTWRTLELLHGSVILPLPFSSALICSRWLSEALGFVPESNVTKLSSVSLSTAQIVVLF